MPDVLAENLSDMVVMGTDGGELGELYNITMDVDSGKLIDLVIEPHEETAFDADLDVDDDGRYHVPVAQVQSVKDYIVVKR